MLQIAVFAVGIGDVELLEIDVRFVGRIHIIRADEDHLTGRLIFLPGGLQFGGFLFAGLAPGSPKIDHDYFAAQV